MSLSPKQALRSLSDSALGDRLKTALRFRAPKLIRPFSKNATVSDLFPWRVDETWDTRFDVMNIPSIIFPEQAVEDIASIHIFDHDGNRLSTHQIKVPPFSSVPVMIRSLLKNSSGTGTFACFHAAIGQHELTEAGSIIAERNYVSFRQQEDTLWSYVHGNANALVKPNDNDSLKTLAGKPENSYSYRPQVRFDDCLRFELIYINPLDRDSRLSVRLLSSNRTETERFEDVLPSKGTRIITIENDGRRCHMIESYGGVPDWRPTVLKFYDSHFDVLHS